MNRDGWWFRATKEQRLAQIDAAIELGMTARQVAMNCGCLYEIDSHGASVPGHRQHKFVTIFANRYGRHFNGASSQKGFFDYIETQRMKHAIERTHDIPDEYLSPFQRDKSEPLLDNYPNE